MTLIEASDMGRVDFYHQRGVNALEALGVLVAVLARAVLIEGEQTIFSVLRDGGGSLGERLTRVAERRVPRTTMVVQMNVELLKLQQVNAPLTASALLRAKAVAALCEQY